MMINFALRIENLQAVRAKAHRELDGSRSVLQAHAMAERRSKIDADFQAGLAALSADYQKEENALHTEMAKARHAARLARVPLSETTRASREAMTLLAPTLSPSELAQAYSDACDSGDIGAQVAIELHVPPAPGEGDPTGRAALMELASRRTAQINARTQKQQAELQAIDARMKSLASEYAQALAPIREQNALSQMQAREPQF